MGEIFREFGFLFLVVGQRSHSHLPRREGSSHNLTNGRAEAVEWVGIVGVEQFFYL